jgi:prepilin-type N-terminal cleavage/methylation domain-containing protein
MRTPRNTTSRQRRLRRAGFTLLELLVALTIGALVSSAVFTLGGAASRHFQEQQRVGVTQRSVRMAMDRVRRDVQRAGFLHVSSTNAPQVLTCPTPAVPGVLPAVGFTNDDPTGNTALASINRSANGVSADRLLLTGNYTTGDSYLVRAVSSSGNTLFLQTSWLAFQRAFTVDNGAGVRVPAPATFQQVFPAGGMVHVESRDGHHFFVNIVSSTLGAGGTTASIQISPSLGVDNPCLDGLGRGALVSPISTIAYSIGSPTPGSALQPRNAAVSGANTVLFRQELNPATLAPVAGRVNRPVLEWAVDFNVVSFLIDQNLTPGNPPNVQPVVAASAAATVAATPWRIRGVVVSVAARTPEQDRRFPWPWTGGRPGGTPLNRFQVFPAEPGAARVRQLTAEILMPNMVPR